MIRIKQGRSILPASIVGLLSIATIAVTAEAQADCYRLSNRWFCGGPASGSYQPYGSSSYQPYGSSAYRPYGTENALGASRNYPGKYTGFPPPGDLSYPGPRPNSAGGP